MHKAVTINFIYGNKAVAISFLTEKFPRLKRRNYRSVPMETETYSDKRTATRDNGLVAHVYVYEPYPLYKKKQSVVNPFKCP